MVTWKATSLDVFGLGDRQAPHLFFSKAAKAESKDEWNFKAITCRGTSPCEEGGQVVRMYEDDVNQ